MSRRSVEGKDVYYFYRFWTSEPNLADGLRFNFRKGCGAQWRETGPSPLFILTRSERGRPPRVGFRPHPQRPLVDLWSPSPSPGRAYRPVLGAAGATRVDAHSDLRWGPAGAERDGPRASPEGRPPWPYGPLVGRGRFRRAPSDSFKRRGAAAAGSQGDRGVEGPARVPVPRPGHRAPRGPSQGAAPVAAGAGPEWRVGHEWRERPRGPPPAPPATPALASPSDQSRRAPQPPASVRRRRSSQCRPFSVATADVCGASGPSGCRVRPTAPPPPK